MSVQCPNCGAPRTDPAVCEFCDVVFETGARAPKATRGFSDEVVAAVRAGNKIEAIRLHRLANKSSLLQAKEAIEQLERQLGLAR